MQICVVVIPQAIVAGTITTRSVALLYQAIIEPSGRDKWLQQCLMQPLGQVSAVTSPICEAIQEKHFTESPLIGLRWTNIHIEFSRLNIQEVTGGFA